MSKVISTRKRMLDACFVSGMFQPISTVCLCGSATLSVGAIDVYSVSGDCFDFGFSTFAMYQVPACSLFQPCARRTSLGCTMSPYA